MGKLIIGKNDLASWCRLNHREDVLTTYDYASNPDPSTIAKGTHTKYLWKCEKCGKSYLRVPHNIKPQSTNECGECIHRNAVESIKRIAIEKNNFEKEYPVLAAEWEHSKNGDLLPDKVSIGFHKKIWWKGKCGHIWEAYISDRVRGDGCPFCSNHRVLSGFNDLQTMNPRLAEEWHPTKNGELLPSEVLLNSSKKAWWLGKCGHEWCARIIDRARGYNCIICRKERQTSFPEQAIFYYISNLFKDAVNSETETIGMELDIYIPSKRVAIEYDGYKWHKRVSVEVKKNNLCNEHGIKLIRVREYGLESFDECECIFREKKQSSKELDSCICTVLKCIDSTVVGDINTERDANKIYSQFIKKTKENSLAIAFPELSSEWHPSKNGVVKPEMVNKSSGKKVWWLGKCGHEWMANINNRVRGARCPYCFGKKVLLGNNDLQTKCPEICREWHPSKNGSLKPSDIAWSSNKRVWWMCEKGHEWITSPNNRSIHQSKCPICNKLRAVICYETGMRYESIASASADMNVSMDCINKCCRGKSKTAGGYHWRYE